jgi:hypothetical protein
MRDQPYWSLPQTSSAKDPIMQTKNYEQLRLLIATMASLNKAAHELCNTTERIIDLEEVGFHNDDINSSLSLGVEHLRIVGDTIRRKAMAILPLLSEEEAKLLAQEIEEVSAGKEHHG